VHAVQDGLVIYDRVSDVRDENDGDMFFSTAEAIYDEAGAANGLAPLRKSEVAARDSDVADYEKTVAADDRASLSPFDVSSEYTFMGAIFHNLARQVSAVTGGWSFVRNIGSIISSGLSSPLLSVSAASDNPEKYEICDDDDYAALGIATSPFCNVERGLPYKSFDETYNYMTSHDHIDADWNPVSADYKDVLNNCIKRKNPLGYSDENDPSTGSECLLNDENVYFYNWYQYQLVGENLADGE
jgi:hypothetical protein